MWFIEENLYQFDQEKSLLVLTGEQSAKFYLAHQGTIEELSLMNILNPVYSDREGFFGRMVGRTLISSGATYEQPKRYVHNKFTSKLKSTIKVIDEQQRIDTIYLFSPKFMLNEILHNLTNDMRNKIKWTISGNLLDKHPFELIKRIEGEADWRKVDASKDEARKLEKRKT